MHSEKRDENHVTHTIKYEIISRYNRVSHNLVNSKKFFCSQFQSKIYLFMRHATNIRAVKISDRSWRRDVQIKNYVVGFYFRIARNQPARLLTEFPDNACFRLEKHNDRNSRRSAIIQPDHYRHRLRCACDGIGHAWVKRHRPRWKRFS